MTGEWLMMMMMMMMMMSISLFGPVGCGRPLRGARHIHINRTQPFIEAFWQSTS
jgi:hypothetical protein